MNIYGTKPERIHLIDETHYFYFPRGGLTKHDYEPATIKEDQFHRIVLSRYHWKLITVWTNLILLEDKPKISFASPWHTPVVQCADSTIHLGLPQGKDANTNTRKKIWALALYTLFQRIMEIARIDNKFVGLPIPYSDVLTDEVVDERYAYSFVGMVGMAIIGSLDKLPIQIREEISIASIRFNKDL